MNVVFGHWRWRRFLLSVYQPLIIFIAPRVKIVFYSAPYCVNRNHKGHVGFLTEHTNLLQVINNTLLRWALIPLNGRRATTNRSTDIEPLIAEKVSLLCQQMLFKKFTRPTQAAA